MTAIATVSIDRSLLSLSALVVDSEGFGSYTIDAQGLGRVGVVPRISYAAASPWVAGQLPVAAVLDESSLSLTIRVSGTSASDLDAKVSALQDALTQFTYSVTVTVSGVAKTWEAAPAAIGAVDGTTRFEQVTAFFEDLAVTIPVYPVAS